MNYYLYATYFYRYMFFLIYTIIYSYNGIKNLDPWNVNILFHNAKLYICTERLQTYILNWYPWIFF